MQGVSDPLQTSTEIFAADGRATSLTFPRKSHAKQAHPAMIGGVRNSPIENTAESKVNCPSMPKPKNK